MGADTAIGWCDCTFNPWWGCVEVSSECDRCYARTWATFTGHGVWGKDAPRRFFGDKHWDDPLRWNRAAERAGERRRVFCASMADILEERDDELGRQLDRARLRLWTVIANTPHLDWILLTKRAGAMARLIPADIRALASVWPGVTCGEASSLWRVEKLLALECAGPRWVSVEPLLGPMDLSKWTSNPMIASSPDPRVPDDPPSIDWIVTGGESGPGYRPMDLSWLTSIAEQCDPAITALFVKQDSAPKSSTQGRIPAALWARKEWPPYRSKQKPWASMPSAGLNLERKFSSAIAAVSSTTWASSN